MIGNWFLRLTPIRENCFCVKFIGVESTPLWAGFKLLYSKHTEVTVPLLDDFEKQWKKNPQGIVKPAVVQVDFRSDETDLRSGASEVSGGDLEVAGR